MTHPAIRDLFEGLGRNPVFQEVLRLVAKQGPQPVSFSGLTNTAKAIYLVLLAQALERPIVVIVDGNKQAEALFELVETFYDLLSTSRDTQRPQMIPALDTLPFQNLSPHNEISEKRAIALWRLATRTVPITITPIASALLRTESREFYRQLALTLRTTEEIALEDVIAHLESIGYERREPVEMVGEYSVRGGILDVFPADSEKPVRIEFFGDMVESMRRFDVETQRSVLQIKEVSILPLVEYPKSRKLFYDLAEHVESDSLTMPGEPFPGWEFWVPVVRPRDYSIFSLMKDPLLIWDEPELTAAAADRLWKRMDDPEKASVCPAEKSFFRWKDLRALVEGATAVSLRGLEVITAADAGAASLHLPTRPSVAFHGNMRMAVSEGRALVEQGGRVVFFAPSTGELERLADILQEYRVPFQLGLDPNDTTPGIPGRARVHGGGGGRNVSGEGARQAGRCLHRCATGHFRIGRLVRHLRFDRTARPIQVTVGGVPGRHRGSEARRFRRSRDARSGEVYRTPHLGPRRAERRLHAAGIRGGS